MIITLTGREKEALIMALASGELTHAELADQFEISKQGVSEFSVRNRAAINQLREAGVEELAGMWGATRRLKMGELEDKYEIAEAAAENPLLTPAERLKHWNLMRQLIRDMNEMCGHLLTRNSVQVESAPRLTHIIEGWDQARWAQDLLASRTGTPDSDRGRGPAPTPATNSEPRTAISEHPAPDTPASPATPTPARDPQYDS